jgi:hypothetical protein
MLFMRTRLSMALIRLARAINPPSVSGVWIDGRRVL